MISSVRPGTQLASDDGTGYISACGRTTRPQHAQLRGPSSEGAAEGYIG